MEFDEITRYAENYSSNESQLLEEINLFTHSNHAQPHMISGLLQGRLLSMISHMINPQRILEIGTFTGYSAVCLAEGLRSEGILHTIELRQETAVIAANFFNKSNYRDQIKLHVGDASEIIPQLNEQWDLVFIDADKPGYKNYFDLIFPFVKKNGFILADNIFFHGEALIADPKNKSAKAIKNFNDFINQRKDIEKVILTVRDGLYLIRKIV